ncbi:MAG: TRAP transporter substrate-binding protein [Deltaproteobacteria bacterium]|nr:TRAP transporter substrate-binding protein [Deltaproteobacteria bacterium]
MSTREALVAVVVAFAVGLLVAGSLPQSGGVAGGEAHAARGAEGPKLRWRVSSAFGTHLPGLGDNVVEVARRLAVASDGRIEWTVDDPDEVVPAFAIVEAVSRGKIAAGYTWLGYEEGRLPASVLFGAVPFGMSPWEYTAWWQSGGGRELAREIYRPLGVEPILCGLIGPETAGWFREAIERPEDLRGLKIRFAGLGGQALQALGASVTMLPGGELFQALEKGAIDATEFSLPEVDVRLGFDRVAKFNYFPGWHQPFTAFHLVVNRPTWEALAPATRELVELACGDGVQRNFAKAEAAQGAVLAGFERNGVTTRTLSPALLGAIEGAVARILDEAAATDPLFARILAHQRAFHADYDRWQRLAYPSRSSAVPDPASPTASRAAEPGDGD